MRCVTLPCLFGNPREFPSCGAFLSKFCTISLDCGGTVMLLCPLSCRPHHFATAVGPSGICTKKYFVSRFSPHLSFFLSFGRGMTGTGRDHVSTPQHSHGKKTVITCSLSFLLSPLSSLSLSPFCSLLSALSFW